VMTLVVMMLFVCFLRESFLGILGILVILLSILSFFFLLFLFLLFFFQFLFLFFFSLDNKAIEVLGFFFVEVWHVTFSLVNIIRTPSWWAIELRVVGIIIVVVITPESLFLNVRVGVGRVPSMMTIVVRTTTLRVLRM